MSLLGLSRCGHVLRGGMSGGPSGCVAMPAELDFLDRGKALMLH